LTEGGVSCELVWIHRTMKCKKKKKKINVGLYGKMSGQKNLAGGIG